MDDDRLRIMMESRAASIRSMLLTEAQLDELRRVVDGAVAGKPFCDGCGFCCTVNVPMLRIEYTQIRRLVVEDPGLAAAQGLVCPFLDAGVDALAGNLEAYSGGQAATMRALPCRIYPVRPMVCRLFPGPGEQRCRPYHAAQAPDLVPALLEEESEAFPNLLIQRYYLTQRWEWFGLQIHPDLDSRLQRVPGWALDPAAHTLSLLDGPHWLVKYETSPPALPVVDACDLEPWAVLLFARLSRATSYRELAADDALAVAAEELGRLLATAELTNMLVPVEVGRHLPIRPRGYWHWEAHEAGAAVDGPGGA